MGLGSPSISMHTACLQRSQGGVCKGDMPKSASGGSCLQILLMPWQEADGAEPQDYTR